MAETETKTPVPELNAAYFEALNAAFRVVDKSSMCEFAARLGCHKRAAEVETMVRQTVYAATINYAKNGKPFSFAGKGVRGYSGGGLVDNATAFGFLTGNNWIVVAEVPAADVKSPPKDVEPFEGKYEVLYPTLELLNTVIAYGKTYK